MMSSEGQLSAEMSKVTLGELSDSSSPTRSTLGLFASPPGTPTRPKRNPLRAHSHASLREDAALQDKGAEIRLLGMEISRLHDRMYEIQELRHSSSAPTERLNTLLSSLAEAIAGLTIRVDAISAVDSTAVQDLQVEWTKLLKAQNTLGEEMKEDGWLIRFRTTADQAEAMMDHLQKSQEDLSTYLDKVSASPYEIPQEAPHGDLSISEMLKLNKAHESMRSVNKILKMMARSLAERTTKNGESLRRYGDMEVRWTGLQRSLAHLDARVRLSLSQYEISGEEIEILDDGTSSPGEAFTGKNRIRSQPSAYTSPSSSTAGGLQRRPSATSMRSTNTSRPDKPRWNVSTKADHPPKDKRASFGYTGRGYLDTSPSSSVSGGSRIPVPATPRRTQAYESITPTPNLTVPSPLSTPPHPSLYRPPNTTQTSRVSLSRMPTAPLVSASAPRPRIRSNGPPSAYRPTTPSPFIPSRPSSRQSMTGSVLGHRAGSVRGPAQDLKPFQPSKYDLLDQSVASIIAEEGFDLFVARVDQPLGRGQRRAEGEEWKGEYVFGAGEKNSSVKLLTLAGTKVGSAAGVKRTKCLVRAQGMWVGLAEVLRERKARQGDVF